MGAKTLFDLVCLALPVDVAPEELRAALPDERWRANEEEAVAEALRECPRIDWQAYLARYPDVVQAKMDPCEHFLRNGMYEGRKLTSRQAVSEAIDKDRPTISIIISNYNNAVTLPKCIGSAIAQALGNIEIIVVDDASSDGSVNIIKKFMEADSRVKLIAKSQNEGPFIARGDGLAASSGAYIMFLDSDDYLPPDACEIAYNEALKGYDIIDGGAHILAANESYAKRAEALSQVINRPEEKEYSTEEALNATYITYQLPWTLWAKLFVREVCVKAYASLDRGFFLIGEDGYTMLAILRFARNLKKIPQKIYCYSFGSGISTKTDPGNALERFIRGETVKATGEYARKYGLNIGFEAINKKRCRDALSRWLEGATTASAGALFEQIKNLFGFDTVLTTLVENWGEARGYVASRFKHCALPFRVQARSKRRAGIFYHCLSVGGVERIIADLASELARTGYELTVFIERKTTVTLPLPPGVDLVYLREGFGASANVMAHVSDLEARIKKNPIDIMLYMSAYAPYTLWDLILLHHYKIPVIIANHGSFVMPFIKNSGVYSHHAQEAVLRCADAVICLSSPAELYGRLHGINAWRITNPIHPVKNQQAREVMPRVIAVMGRLGDPLKRIGESLRVLADLVRAYPGVKMLLIGDFDKSAQRQEFLAKLRELGISENVTLTGWVDNPTDYLAKCGVLLSTSYCESFGLAIAEAQAQGLPCVNYDLPIEQAQDNESIISVPQGDYEAAAAAIADLFDDPEHWRKLSEIAQQKAARFSPEDFYARMLEIIDNFDRYSPWKPYSRNDYRDLIKYSAFYAGHKKPQELWQF